MLSLKKSAIDTVTLAETKYHTHCHLCRPRVWLSHCRTAAHCLLSAQTNVTHLREASTHSSRSLSHYTAKPICINYAYHICQYLEICMQFAANICQYSANICQYAYTFRQLSAQPNAMPYCYTLSSVCAVQSNATMPRTVFYLRSSIQCIYAKLICIQYLEICMQFAANICQYSANICQYAYNIQQVCDSTC